MRGCYCGGGVSQKMGVCVSTPVVLNNWPGYTTVGVGKKRDNVYFYTELHPYKRGALSHYVLCKDSVVGSFPKNFFAQVS